MSKSRIRRCAIYTRKSSEEGLEQVFNSLDAQREACEAYIKSQAGEGWKATRTRYDDGGVSGGTMDRPALQQLLDDIRAHKIDTVVVYKVDRLTRALADFAKMVEIFDAHDVSFVSVTQQFNTTTSMGRLTLNMLLSFAQFEREVTGERIRDKIAASKKKGMWMGGFVPLGYEPDGRTLVINETEAQTVRTVFDLYLELGNVRQVKEEADRRGVVTKRRQCADGRMRGGRPLSRGYIYKLLNNPLYVGRIAHKGATYEGQHAPIIESEIWDEVQKRLAANAHNRRRRSHAAEPSPLAGRIFDERGIPLSPSHAVKKGRRYRYYVSRDLIAEGGGPSNGPPRDGWRLPAGEIERLVSDAVTGLFANRLALVDAARAAGMAPEHLSSVLGMAANRLGQPLDLVDRVNLGANHIMIDVKLITELGEPATVIRHTVLTKIKRRGVEMRLVIEGPSDGTAGAKPDKTLIKAIVRAHGWFDDLVSGRAQSANAIAQREGITDRYVSHLLPLAFLAPDIVEKILAGTQPVDLTTEKLIRRTNLPLGWPEQKALLGVD